MSTGKDAAIGLRTNDTIKKAAMKAAEAQHRTVSSLCEKLIYEHLVSAGYVKPDQAPPSPSAPKAETME